MSQGSLRVVCIGGGLTGLALALACHRLGVRVDVYEQAAQFREIGAGLSVQTNACRLINDFLNLENEYEHIYNPAGHVSVRYRDWSTGESLQDLLHATHARPQDTGRYVSRADLLDIFRFAIRPDQLHTGKKLTSIERVNPGGPYIAHFADGTFIEADIIAAADGIHSTSRKILARWSGQPEDSDRAVYTGEHVWRGIVPRELVPPESHLLLETDPGALITRGNHRHIMTYPIGRGSRAVNVVLYTPEEHDGSDSWTAKGDVNDLREAFAGWTPDVMGIIDGMSRVDRQCYKQALYYRATLDQWTDGGLALLGDAAHAMPPYLGQGSAMGIEDAVAFAILLQGATHANKATRLRAYVDLRQSRTDRLARATLFQGRINSAADTKELSAEERAHMSDRSWIWQYRVDEEASRVLADLRAQGQ